MRHHTQTAGCIPVHCTVPVHSGSTSAWGISGTALVQCCYYADLALGQVPGTLGEEPCYEQVWCVGAWQTLVLAELLAHWL